MYSGLPFGLAWYFEFVPAKDFPWWAYGLLCFTFVLAYGFGTFALAFSEVTIELCAAKIDSCTDMAQSLPENTEDFTGLMARIKRCYADIKAPLHHFLAPALTSGFGCLGIGALACYLLIEGHVDDSMSSKIGTMFCGVCALSGSVRV